MKVSRSELRQIIAESVAEVVGESYQTSNSGPMRPRETWKTVGPVNRRREADKLGIDRDSNTGRRGARNNKRYTSKRNRQTAKQDIDIDEGVGLSPDRPHSQKYRNMEDSPGAPVVELGSPDDEYSGGVEPWEWVYSSLVDLIDEHGLQAVEEAWRIVSSEYQL